MSACMFMFSGYGLDPDNCGEPSDFICEDCDKPICREHAVPMETGYFKCSRCADELKERVRAQARRAVRWPTERRAWCDLDSFERRDAWDAEQERVEAAERRRGDRF